MNHILFMGTPEFAVPTLAKIIQTFTNTTITVITGADKIRGRGKKTSPSPVKKIALNNHLAVYTPKTTHEATKTIRQLNPDIIVVAAYGMILEEQIVNSYVCINVHASLLPQYRGASPIQASLLNGDKTTGISIIQLVKQMDAGPILRQVSIDISIDENHGSLSKKLSDIGAHACVLCIKNYQETAKMTGIQQDHATATYCSKIQKADLLLHAHMGAHVLLNKIRAFSPKPGAYCIQGTTRIKIIRACIKNNHLHLLDVQPEGKSVMPYSDYILGSPTGIDLNGV